MQSCVVCGWDTRSGSDVCAACRAAQDVDSAAAAGGPLSEAEALLATALRSAHGVGPAAADVTDAEHAEHVTDENDDADRGDPALEMAGDTTGEFLAIVGDDAMTHERTAADDLSELFNTRSPWDEPGERDTSDDLAALFGEERPWREPPAIDAGPATSDGHLTHSPPPVQQPPPVHVADDLRPVDNDLADADAPAPEIDTREPRDRNADAYPAEHWPWVTKYGDGGFWAPPESDAPPEADAPPASAAPDAPAPADSGAYVEPAATRPPDDHHDDAGYAAPEYRDTDVAHPDPLVEPPGDPDGGQPVPADRPDHTAAAEPLPQADEPRPYVAEPPPAGRVRTLFRQMGGWTAVAQIALLAVGMLCVIQIFVLVLVLSYLSDAADAGGDSAASMAAYGKVDSVMLPALFAFAVGALVLAAWRALAEDRSSATRRQPLGLSLGLWGVVVGVMALLGVIVASDATMTVPDARRITQLALGACGVLALACFTAPRSLAQPPGVFDADLPPVSDEIPT